MRVILGLSPQGKKIYCGCSRARCYEDYLDLRIRKGEEAGGNCILKSTRVGTSSKYYYGDQIMENDMGSACGARGKDVTFIRNFSRGNLWVEVVWNACINGRKILKFFLEELVRL